MEWNGMLCYVMLCYVMLCMYVCMYIYIIVCVYIYIDGEQQKPKVKDGAC